MTKPCHLEVIDSGGWRRVMTFDATVEDYFKRLSASVWGNRA